jgi:hypothetical protein
MNRRTKHTIIVLAWLGGFFLVGSGVWNFQAGHLMILIYAAVSMLMYMSYAFLARCPQCREPVLLRPLKVLGMELYTWSILRPTNCRHCGALLP